MNPRPQPPPLTLGDFIAHIYDACSDRHPPEPGLAPGKRQLASFRVPDRLIVH
jgi:hypothetical protein